MQRCPGPELQDFSFPCLSGSPNGLRLQDAHRPVTCPACPSRTAELPSRSNQNWATQLLVFVLGLGQSHSNWAQVAFAPPRHSGIMPCEAPTEKCGKGVMILTKNMVWTTRALHPQIDKLTWRTSNRFLSSPNYGKCDLASRNLYGKCNVILHPPKMCTVHPQTGVENAPLHPQTGEENATLHAQTDITRSSSPDHRCWVLPKLCCPPRLVEWREQSPDWP